MSKTKIEYGDRTWNVLTGCTIKSEGCVNCWARGMAKRLKAMERPEYQDAVDDTGNWTSIITFLPDRLKEPLTWRKPQHVLVEYMGDLFHKNVPADYIDRVFDVMKQTPQHTYQLLTKRPDQMAMLLQDYEPLPNVVLGASVENQKRADERVEPMHFLSVRGWRTWVSYEPALGLVDWSGWKFLDQLICGGESGANARPMHPDWARFARDFCVKNKIPFFFKQYGEWSPREGLKFEIDENTKFKNKPIPWGDEVVYKVGKSMSKAVLDGFEWRELPKYES
jgi:protein gp37